MKQNGFKLYPVYHSKIFSVLSTLLVIGDTAVNKTKPLLNMSLVCIYRMSDSNMELKGKECLAWERVMFTIICRVTTVHLSIESHLSRVMKEMSHSDTRYLGEKYYRKVK